MGNYIFFHCFSAFCAGGCLSPNPSARRTNLYIREFARTSIVSIFLVIFLLEKGTSSFIPELSFDFRDSLLLQ